MIKETIMTEFLLGLATGYLLTWPGIIGLCFLGIIFEHTNHRGFAVFAALVALVSAFFFFHIDFQTLAYATISYIAVGLAWSVYRYRRFIRTEVERLKRENYSTDTLKRYVAAAHPLQMVDTIVAWIIIWPFSVIEHAISDILDTVQLLVTRVFRSVYIRIYEAATKGLVE
jgi:hypothetical protein